MRDALEAIGIDAELTQDLSTGSIHNLGEFDAVAFGRAVPELKRERIRAEFRAANPDVVFVDGLAPITPLLVAQFQEALDRRPPSDRLITDLTVDHDRVSLGVRSDCQITLMFYRLDRLHRTRVDVLTTKLSAGRHAVQVPKPATRAKEFFTVVRTEHEVRVATPV